MPKVRVSSVWQHYDINPECENFAVCRHCGSNISRGGMASNLKGNNTTNLWTHLRYKHSDEVDLGPHAGPPRKRPINQIKGKNVRASKVKPQTFRVPKTRVTDSQPNDIGALPSKWEQYDQGDEIGDDIKDIIYTEDPLCYSPIEEDDEPTQKMSVVASTRASEVAATSTPIVTSSPSKKTSLETSIHRLAVISEQLSYIVQQTHEDQSKDDDYYFALSLAPIMRQLSLNRKLYVRSRIQEILFEETEGVSSKAE